MSEIPGGGIERPGEFRVIPNYERLDEVMGILIEARAHNDFPYNLESAQLPHDERNMPPSLKRGGVEHANFLWAVCYYMRGGIKSATAVRSLSSVYEKYPELFIAEHAQSVKPEFIYEALRDNGLHFSAKPVSEYWVENARRMQERYQGDPRKIFDGSPEYPELCRLIQNDGKGGGFKGFQKKMVSMYAYYLMDSRLVDYYNFPLPVDMHVLRVSAATDIITFENVPPNGNIYTEETLDTLRHMYHDYSVRHGVSQLDVCNAVWSLSSAICGIQPGNVMLEPNRHEGRNGRSTHIVPLDVDFSKPSHRRMYDKSCSRCPLDDEGHGGPLCHRNMPSKLYYVHGVAVLSERLRPSDGDEAALFGVSALAVRRRGRADHGPQTK